MAPNPGRTYKIPIEDGYILKMSDVQAVGLRARLVVLSSSCKDPGEFHAAGVIRMAQAFLAIGARSVLVSLLRLDDKATMQLMRSFYQQLAHGKTASVALHKAMKSLGVSPQFGGFHLH